MHTIARVLIAHSNARMRPTRRTCPPQTLTAWMAAWMAAWTTATCAARPSPGWARTCAAPPRRSPQPCHHPRRPYLLPTRTAACPAAATPPPPRHWARRTAPCHPPLAPPPGCLHTVSVLPRGMYARTGSGQLALVVIVSVCRCTLHAGSRLTRRLLALLLGVLAVKQRVKRECAPPRCTWCEATPMMHACMHARSAGCSVAATCSGSSGTASNPLLDGNRENGRCFFLLTRSSSSSACSSSTFLWMSMYCLTSAACVHQ